MTWSVYLAYLCCWIGVSKYTFLSYAYGWSLIFAYTLSLSVCVCVYARACTRVCCTMYLYSVRSLRISPTQIRLSSRVKSRALYRRQQHRNTYHGLTCLSRGDAAAPGTFLRHVRRAGVTLRLLRDLNGIHSFIHLSSLVLRSIDVTTTRFGYLDMTLNLFLDHYARDYMSFNGFRLI